MTSPLPQLDMVVHIQDLGCSDSREEVDEWETPIFAFHDLDYIPSGYGGILAPYIETGPGTMRAAATLMRLDLIPDPEVAFAQQVVCDLGCGDGEFLIGLLHHINNIANTTSLKTIHGFGVDYNAELIKTAAVNAVTAGENAQWLTYDFNLDEDNLLGTLEAEGVTHVFVYLVPKQLALKTVRALLTKLSESGVLICCHKFQPGYLKAARTDILMDLVVYDGGI